MKKIILLLAIGIFSTFRLFAAEYDVDPSKDNSVKFISDAQIETFEGNTKKIDGYLDLTGESDLYNAKLHFEVDLNSVDTGIGLRNRHMREEYLETNKYPFTTFDGLVNEVSKVSDREYNVKVTGDMNIHGVKRKITVPGKIFLQPNSMRIKTNFSVKLTEYNIEVPKLMFMKISDEIKLVLDFYLKK